MNNIYEKKYLKYKKKYLSLKKYLAKGGNSPNKKRKPRLHFGKSLSLNINQLEELNDKHSELFQELIDNYQAKKITLRNDNYWETILNDMEEFNIHVGEVDFTFENKPLSKGFESSENKGANGEVYINKTKNLFLKKVYLKNVKSRILSLEDELKKQIRNIIKLLENKNSECKIIQLKKIIIGYNKISKQYIVWTLMPICDSFSIDKLDTNQKKYNFLKQLKKGISELHSIGLVHRDLKSNNIVLCNECSGNENTWVIIDLDGLTGLDNINDNSELDIVGRTKGYWFQIDTKEFSKEKHFNFLKRLDWYAYGIIACQVFGLIKNKSQNDSLTCVLDGVACFVENYSLNYAQTINCILNFRDEKIQTNIDYFKKIISSLLIRNQDDYQKSYFKLGDRFWDDDFELTKLGRGWIKAENL